MRKRPPNVATTVKASDETAAALRQKVKEPFRPVLAVLAPTVSIGAAAFPADADTAEALFQRADEALYRAKQGGKNRVCR
ncbi:MAG: diguanylate cyclase [Deltaproteobacteria bacterium]|nr:diguanylate cyclase [Deltaproteobacteria bacterium]